MTTFDIISKLEDDWDGEGGLAPNQISLANAESFMNMLPKNIIEPEVMINANGNSGLFWNESQFYAELEFLDNHKIVYFIEKNGEPFKGTTFHHNNKISTILINLLTINNR